MSPSTFEIYPEGTRWRWRFIANGTEVMVSAEAYVSEQDARDGIDRLRDALQQRTVIKRTGNAPSSRWRPIAADGTVGPQSELEMPDMGDDEEGETGPPEMQ